MKEPKNRFRCHSKIWRKLTNEQKLRFNRTYEHVLRELGELSRIHNASKAHNVACMAAWGEFDA
jgi:hypothetical protein